MRNAVDPGSRELGTCPVCRQSVLFSDNFVPLGGLVLHLRCALARRTRRFSRQRRI
jgi:hypothetical protein